MQRRWTPTRCSFEHVPGVWGLLKLFLVLSSSWGTLALTPGAYTPGCRTIPDPPPRGFRRWSDPRTWAPLPVPGVGKQSWGTVVIGCNQAILLDVPSLRLHLLEVRGLLRVEDPVWRRRAYQIEAHYVLVEGQLHVGYPWRHFQSSLKFLLRAAPNRQPFVATFNPPGPAYIGHKAFAIVGGQVLMYGMPGGKLSPSWTKLTASVSRGQRVLTVSNDVRRLWPVGGQVAVSSTDYDPHNVDWLTITGFSKSRAGCHIYLNKPLTFPHWGSVRGIPDGFGGFVDERAEVALLTRNIVVQGDSEPAPHNLEGGHFVVYQTRRQQILEGVEFTGMGQQGSLGRYPVHFHVCGDMARRSVVRKCSVHHSLQRCIVVHATDSLVVEGNVAFDTAGHCFMLEEGGEQRNLFQGNLGILTVRPQRTISPEESDGSPATFWISNLRNDFIGNVAAGSEDSGFWFELKAEVRGMSRDIPGVRSIHPIHALVRTFQGNVLHSNAMAGLKTYPGGYSPAVPVTLSGFRVFKHRFDGLLLQTTQGIVISDSVFADNGFGVRILGNGLGQVQDSTFVGLSPNLGDAPTPEICATQGGPYNCAPVSGCSYPPVQGNTRRLYGTHWQTPIFGVALGHFGDVISPWLVVARTRFSGFNARCRPAAGIGVGIDTTIMPYWSTSIAVRGLNWNRRDGTVPVWLAPGGYALPDGGVLEGGPAAWQYAIQDVDGSITGGRRGGYVIRPWSFLVPPSPVKGKSACRDIPNAQALACPGACFRSVKVLFTESSSTSGREGGLSSLMLRRSDGAWSSMTGNQKNKKPQQGAVRWFRMSLYAPAAYTMSIVPPPGTRGFRLIGEGFLVFTDARPCAGVVAIRALNGTFRWR